MLHPATAHHHLKTLYHQHSTDCTQWTFQRDLGHVLSATVLAGSVLQHHNWSLTDLHWARFLISSYTRQRWAGCEIFQFRVQCWSEKIESDPVLIRKIFENQRSDPVLICPCKIMYFHCASWGKNAGAVLPSAKHDWLKAKYFNCAFASWGKIDTAFCHFENLTRQCLFWIFHEAWALLELLPLGEATRTRSKPLPSVQVSLFYCLTAFRPERTAAFRALLTATDHNGCNAKSNPKLADAIKNLGAVSGVVVLCVQKSRRSLTLRWWCAWYAEIHCCFCCRLESQKSTVIELLCPKVLFCH